MTTYTHIRLTTQVVIVSVNSKTVTFRVIGGSTNIPVGTIQKTSFVNFRLSYKES